MVNVQSKLRKYTIDTERLKNDAQKLLNYLEYPDFDLGILLTTNTTIQKFNHEFRNKNSATDVLSFPYHSTLQAGQKIKIHSSEDKNLGDIIMSPEYVQKNLARYNTTDMYHALQILLVHSIAHLLGYVHDTDAHHAHMQVKEKELLNVIH